MSGQIGERLSGALSCRVDWDGDVLDAYSADASQYRVRPEAVVFAERVEDVVGTVRFAAGNGVSVTARGGGTGLVGGALGGGIILSMKGMTGTSLGDGSITAYAGTTKGEIDRALAGSGMFLSPNPSVGPYCTIGGMIATNAGGPLSLKYGSVIDNVLEIEFVDGLGVLRRFPDGSGMSADILEIAGGIDRGRYPQVAKNSSGYRLDAVASTRDAHKALAGSEGTLGIIVSARFRLHRLPAARRLRILGYESMRGAAGDCAGMAGTGPECLELVDCDVVRSATDAVPAWARYMLMIEYAGEQAPGGAGAQFGRLVADTSDPGEIAEWWRLRNSSLALEMGSAGAFRTPQVIEDATVPLGSLKGLVSLIEETERRFGVRLAVYGHAGSGNPHVLLAGRGLGAERIGEIAGWYFAGVVALGGTITGEHGDGIARTPFVGRQYGERNLAAFRRLKGLLDPKGILNPGKIVSARNIPP